MGCRKKVTMSAQIFLLFSFSLLSFETALAQPVSDTGVAVPAGKLSESFDTAKVFSNTLAGIKFGAFTGLVDPDQIVIAVPDEIPETICVEIKTQDARFFALNPYNIKVDQRVKKVRLSPITLQYRTEIIKYEKTSFAVKSYKLRNGICNPNGEMLLPEIGTSAKSDTLTVLVNSRSRIATAVLSKETFSKNSKDTGQMHIERVDCHEHNSDVAVAFDAVCQFSIFGKGFTGVNYLQISLDDGFGVKSYNYSVFLPTR